MSGTSKAELYQRAESTYGSWLSGFGNGTINAVRYVGWSVVEDVSYTQSNEINPSRNPQDQIKVDSRVSGALTFELSYDNRWIALAVQSLLNDVNGTVVQTDTDTTYGMSQVTNELTSSDAGLHLVLNAVSGDWLSISGFSTNADMIAKAAQVTISGTFTTYTATLTARAGLTEGTKVEGATSGAIGYLVAIDTGAPKTYTIKVISGVFQAGETVQREDGAAGSISVIVIDSAAAILSGYKLATEAATPSVTVRKLSAAYPGSTTRSSSFELKQGDLSSVYEVFLGCMFTSCSIVVPPKGAITGAFQIKGASKHLRTATAGGAGLITAASSNPVMQCETNFKACLMGGAEGVLYALSDTDNSSTTVCTTATPHGLQTGDLVVIEQNADTDNNRNWLVTYVDDYNFTLQGSSAQTAQTGSNAGYFRKLKVAKTVVDCSVQWDNQLREETSAGVPGIVAQPIGTLAVTGTANIYFASLVEQRRYKSDEYTGIAFVFQETTDPTHVFVIEVPRIKYTSAPSPIDGNNQSRTQSIAFAGSLDPTEQIAMRFCY